MVKIVLAADHAGFVLKEKIRLFLVKRGCAIQDFSPELVEEDDFPDYAFKAGEAVAQKKLLGIFVCGSGIGMSICANKVEGVRAALVDDRQMAIDAKVHNNANVICLGGRRTKVSLAKSIVDAWMSAEYGGGRFERRNRKITAYERN